MHRFVLALVCLLANAAFAAPIRIDWTSASDPSSPSALGSFVLDSTSFIASLTTTYPCFDSGLGADCAASQATATISSFEATVGGEALDLAGATLHIQTQPTEQYWTFDLTDGSSLILFSGLPEITASAFAALDDVLGDYYLPNLTAGWWLVAGSEFQTGGAHYATSVPEPRSLWLLAAISLWLPVRRLLVQSQRTRIY